jgi:hypothetical protein
MPYKDPIKAREHSRMRTRKYRSKEGIKELERIKRKERYIVNAEKEKAYQKGYINRYPDRYKATRALNNALNGGHIKKEPCSKCGVSENVHGHHNDYKFPLEVNWLCASCHMKLHKERENHVTC